eukprot:40185-Prymnesium_polylepis.2
MSTCFVVITKKRSDQTCDPDRPGPVMPRCRRGGVLHSSTPPVSHAPHHGRLTACRLNNASWNTQTAAGQQREKTTRGGDLGSQQAHEPQRSAEPRRPEPYGCVRVPRSVWRTAHDLTPVPPRDKSITSSWCVSNEAR